MTKINYKKQSNLPLKKFSTFKNPKKIKTVQIRFPWKETEPSQSIFKCGCKSENQTTLKPWITKKRTQKTLDTWVK